MAKKKRRIKVPSLSPVDKAIYSLLIICSLAAALFLYPAIIGNYRQKIFQDSHTLAQDSLGIVILVFFGLFLFSGFALLLDSLRRRRQAILGKSNIDYGPPQWKPVYPIFSRSFWIHFVSNKKQALIVFTAFVLLVIAMIGISMLALPPRNCLYDDCTVAIYNCFNECTYEYTDSDIAQVRLFTRKPSGRRLPDNWCIEMEITMYDGEDFFFAYDDFQTFDDHIRGFLTGMYQIKTQLDPSKVILEGAENIPYVIQAMNLNQQEIDLLYLLFDLKHSVSS